jgi:hypothetical protein
LTLTFKNKVMSLNKRLINTGGVFTPEFAAGEIRGSQMLNDDNFSTKIFTFTLDYLDPTTNTYINYYTQQWNSGSRNYPFTPSFEEYATNTFTRRTIRVVSTDYAIRNYAATTLNGSRLGSYQFSSITGTVLNTGDNFYPSFSSTSISATCDNNGNNYNLTGFSVEFLYTL